MNWAALENIRKFSAMSNAEAYVEAFHNRLMRPLPDSDVTGEYWGSTTRLDFYPLLREALAELSCNRDVKILDVGAGGEIIGGFRDGMVTVETPQVVCLIKKHSKD